MSISKTSGYPATVPDGGWGWVIVFGVVITNMFTQSLGSLFGLLFGEHIENMNHGTTGAALVANLNTLSINFSGFFIGPAIKSFAPRKVTFTGTLLTSLGLLLCSISTQLWHIILAYSILVGVGLGLIAPSTFMIINSYFSKRRGSAVGLALAGTGLGQMITPHIVRYLLDHYGFRTTVITMGGLALHGLVGASFFEPLKQKIHEVKLNENHREIKLLLDEKKENITTSMELNKVNIINIDCASNNSLKEVSKCQKIITKLSKLMDFELLKDPIFWSICLGMGLVYTATTNFSMIFPYFLQNSLGLSRQDTAFCMSILAGADIISRLCLPLLTDKLNVSYRLVFLLGAIGLFCTRTIIAETTEFYTIIIASSLYGSVKAATVINNNLTVSEHCKTENLAGGLGFNMISKGVLIMSVGQMLGWIRDHSGSYSLCLHAQNIAIGIVIIVWSPELIYNFIKRRRRNSEVQPNSI